ncbi:MAG: hypothetical protein ACE5EK_09975, partial [Nitrospinales bacterium]
MLAFAKDITKKDPSHPEESKIPKLAEYMDYQRKLDHELLIYNSLDHAKTYLLKNIEEGKSRPAKLKTYLEKAFPISHTFASADILLTLLRQMINGHNSTNNWYRMNAYYHAVFYDCLERFVRLYNRMVKEAPDKAEKYNFTQGMEIDFDDWVQLYFQDLDFMLGKTMNYPHYIFSKRNKTINQAMEKAMQEGKSREEVLEMVKIDYEIDESSLKVIQGKTISNADMELFYTSVENPIYEYLYSPDFEGGFID